VHEKAGVYIYDGTFVFSKNTCYNQFYELYSWSLHVKIKGQESSWCAFLSPDMLGGYEEVSVFMAARSGSRKIPVITSFMSYILGVCM
jgi:hypothetical protein